MIIETPRLLLRQMTHGDVPALLAVFCDVEAMRYYPAAFDEARMQAWVDWNMRSYEARGYGLWAMILRATGEVIGDCGLVSQQVDGVQEVEVGYHVRRDQWGQGLATEAALACVHYGFTTIGCRRLVSLINPLNVPSRRVAEKIGMKLQREVEWKNKPTCIYQIENQQPMATTITLFNSQSHRDQVIALWNAVFGYESAHNEPSLVIDTKLAADDGLFFVAIIDNQVIGTIMAGYDGHRGWIYSVAVHPERRKQGIGSQLVAHAERALTERGCMKINLQIVAGNESVAAFYASLGYAVEQRVSMGKRIHANIPT